MKKLILSSLLLLTILFTGQSSTAAPIGIPVNPVLPITGPPIGIPANPVLPITGPPINVYPTAYLNNAIVFADLPASVYENRDNIYLPVSAAFGTSFSSINSITISLSFVDDLLDPMEGIGISLQSYGNLNINHTSNSLNSISFDIFRPSALNLFLDGYEEFRIYLIGQHCINSQTCTPRNEPYSATINSISVGAWVPAPVPEPGTILLLGTGLVGVIVLRNKFKIFS